MNAARLQKLALIAATLAGPLVLSGCLSLAIGGSGTRRESQWAEGNALTNPKALELESRITAIENRLTTVENRVRALREDEAKRQKVSYRDLDAIDAEIAVIRSAAHE